MQVKDFKCRGGLLRTDSVAQCNAVLMFQVNGR